MKKKLKINEQILVGIMLFSLFFGAGNLIFPPYLGQEAGSAMPQAILGFLLSAVGFPILGVIAVARTDGLKNLSSKVGPLFASIYTILIYLSIGPLLGIPRAGSLPYEMVLAPYISDTSKNSKALFVFTLVFFAIALILSMKPSKLLDRMGKFLTPALLILLLLVFFGSFFKNYPEANYINHPYREGPMIVGFLDGYQTMDTIAALNFGLVISLIIQSLGVKEHQDIIKSTIKSGLIAGMLLITIYTSLAYLGKLSGAKYGSTSNGAQTLANIMLDIFGAKGLWLLAIIFTLACLTTAIGLITSISQYFTEVTRLDYKSWVYIFTIWSFIISNVGLDQILVLSIPILSLIYPVSLVLIIISFFDRHFINQSMVYKNAAIISFTLSLTKVLEDLNVFKLRIVKKIPFYDLGLGWLIPSIIIVLLTWVFEMTKAKKF